MDTANMELCRVRHVSGTHRARLMYFLKFIVSVCHDVTCPRRRVRIRATQVLIVFGVL